MSARAVTRAGAAVIGIASLLAAGWSIMWQAGETRLLAATTASQIAPLPAGIAASAAQLVEQSPLTNPERFRLDNALWRSPLEPQWVNLLYADAVRAGQPTARTRQLADLLSRLGWRYTPAQQNLTLRALMEARFHDALDRVDALLRRQKLVAFDYTLLATMEAVPEVHDDVVDKLRERPGWRADYLSVIGPQSGLPLRAARVATLATLLRSPSSLSREEMAPSLAALVGSGQARVAYALWLRRTSRAPAGNLVYDPRFRQATAFAGGSDLDIAFEWRFTQNTGYATQVSADGVTIDWNRHGVPAFLSQLVPLSPGHRYELVLQGRADHGDLSALLTSTLVCGSISVGLEPMGGTPQGKVRYVSNPLPASCDMGILTIGGGLNTGSGNVTMTLTEVSLQQKD